MRVENTNSTDGTEKRWGRYSFFFVLYFLMFPVIAIGGMLTAASTFTEEDFEIVFHVVFLGVLNGVSLISIIGSVHRHRELKKFTGDVVAYSWFSKKRFTMSKDVVLVQIKGTIIFGIFIVLSTGLKLLTSIIELLVWLSS